MPTITEERRKQIADIEARIASEVECIQNKKKELEDTINVPESARDQISRGVSSSTKRRGKGETVGKDQTTEMYQRIVEDFEKAIGARERGLDRLRAEKRALESYEQGA